MFSEFNSADSQHSGFLGQADELRVRIRSRDYFSRLPVKRQNHILKGEHALLLSQNELLERMSEHVGTFRGIYHYLSFHVHTLPVSYYRMEEREQGRGLESDWEKSNITNALVFAVTPMHRATREIRQLFLDVVIGSTNK